jgi:hypothetical protein
MLCTEDDEQHYENKGGRRNVVQQKNTTNNRKLCQEWAVGNDDATMIDARDGNDMMREMPQTQRQRHDTQCDARDGNDKMGKGTRRDATMR